MTSMVDKRRIVAFRYGEHNTTWIEKVRGMDDNQVIAIYLRMMEEASKPPKPSKPKAPPQPTKKESDDGGQDTLF